MSNGSTSREDLQGEGREGHVEAVPIPPLVHEVEPYRDLARCILAIFQKYAIFAQFWRIPLSLAPLKTCQFTIWFHFTSVAAGPIDIARIALAAVVFLMRSALSGRCRFFREGSSVSTKNTVLRL